MSWKRKDLDSQKPDLKPVLTSVKYNFSSKQWTDKKEGRFISPSEWVIPSLFPNVESTITFTLRDDKQEFDYNSFGNIEHFFFCFNTLEPDSTGLLGHATFSNATKKCEHSKLLSILSEKQIESVTKQDLIWDENYQYRNFWTDADLVNETHYLIDSKLLSRKFLFRSERPFKGYVSMDENK